MDYEKGTIGSLLKITATEMFINLLKNIDGNKDLILSPDLISTFDLIFGFTLLKANGVQKIYKLESGQTFSTKKLCFVIRPTIGETKMVCNCINSDKQRGIDDNQYWVIFVPQKTKICEECLENEGIYDYIKILEYSLSLIPLDCDIFSLEFPDFIQNCFLFGEQTGLNFITRSLVQLQTLVGSVPYVYSKGKYSTVIAELLSKQNPMLSTNLKNNSVCDQTCILSNLILLDRDEDYVSVFLSQLNYVGILDETFPIRSGKVDFGPEITKNAENKVVKHNLYNNDLVFKDIKDTAFSSVFLSLKEKGQKIKEKYNRSHELNVTAMREFVANELKNLQSQHRSLCLHISACEYIMEVKKDINFAEQLRIEQNLIEGIETKQCLSYIEEGIIRQFSPIVSLRLICLYSISQSGIHSKDYKNIMSLFLQSYGHQHIYTFFNLKKLGIIVENSQNTFSTVSSLASGSRSTDSIRKFRQTVKRLNLIPQINDDFYDVRNPKDCAYVFGGAYIPLISRIVELICDNKNTNEEIFKLIQGKFTVSNQSQNYSNNAKHNSKSVFVFFTGGVTYAEISALRFVAKQKSIQILIGTTSIINGINFLNQLTP